ncbi:hypothetical protein VIGAN_08275900 [Vigna angularis var. angularis]|uniref:Uncharacterized protein n=1 Tax=Vigna angularis var. angularis TaxID=157739 RepID=A0A0S3SSV1_PHAAN|nr:hypothetical protein VIGAN_08275900 [Vigna angularis var. angularis]
MCTVLLVGWTSAWSSRSLHGGQQFGRRSITVHGVFDGMKRCSTLEKFTAGRATAPCRERKLTTLVHLREEKRSSHFRPAPASSNGSTSWSGPIDTAVAADQILMCN